MAKAKAAPDHPRPWVLHYPDGIVWDVEVETRPVHEQVLAACAGKTTATALDFLGATTSFGDLARDIIALAGALQQRFAVKKGVRVALMLPNTPFYVIAYYAVLRAGVALAVMAAGLHPGFGLMHSNRGNPMVLVDDLMEPFRPSVDREVFRLARQGTTKIEKESKAELARVMIVDLPTAAGMSPLMICAERLAALHASAHADLRNRMYRDPRARRA